MSSRKPKAKRRPYIKRMTDRHGRVRLYFFRPGYPRARLPGEPGEPEFEVAYAEALAAPPLFAGPTAGPIRTKPGAGSFSNLCDRYYKTAQYIALGSTTQRTYMQTVERLRELHGEKPVKLIDRKAIKRIIDARAATPAAANQDLRLLRLLLDVAVADDERDDNPARLVKRLKMPGEGFLPWNERHIARFKAFHPEDSKARLALDLLLCTAQRRGDITRLGFENVDGDLICLTQRKTKAYLEIPIHPDLAAWLDRLPLDAPAFLMTEYGRPYTPAGFGGWFGDRCREAGLGKGYNAHGLRKAACRRLAEAGCTPHEIMSISGHKTLAEVERYTKAARQKLMARTAMSRVGGGSPEIGKPSGKPGISSIVSRLLALPTAMIAANENNRLSGAFSSIPPAMPH